MVICLMYSLCLSLDDITCDTWCGIRGVSTALAKWKGECT